MQTITRAGNTLAYHQTPGTGPGLVFLGGFMSDMEGTKAVELEAWARAEGRAYLRLDYSGHGQSGGAFTDGCIGSWMEDAVAVIRAATTGPQILIGSSMGGWIALLIAREHPDLVAGLVTIAAAPDFTEDGFWAGFDARQRAEVMEGGQTMMPSGYGDPYTITRGLIEDGRHRLVLRSPLPLPIPVRMVQGTDDEAVTTETALRLLNHVTCDDIRLTLVRGSDHRFSEPDDLDLIRASITEVLTRVQA